MEDIIIDGINLAELKIRYDALAAEQLQMRQSIQKGASKYISEAIVLAKESMQQLLEAEDQESVDEHSKAAYDILKNAEFVSNVSGVSYILPYYDRQSEYYPYGDPYSSQLENSENELLDYKYSRDNPSDLQKLYGLLEDMEGEVSEWNTSYC